MIEKQTYSLYAHTHRFDTNEKCQAYLMQTRWKDGIPTCPKCENNKMNYYLKTRNVYKCSECYTQFSITQGTIFERTKIPLTQWFLAIFIFTTNKRGISSCQLAKWLGVKQHTAWFMLHRLREGIKEENNIILHGIVEADETYIGPKVNRDNRLQMARKIHEAEQDRIHGLTRSKRLKMGDKKKRGRKKGSTKEVLQQKAIDRGGRKYYSHHTERVPFEKGAVILGMVEQSGRVVMKKLGINFRSVTRENVYPHLLNHITRESIFVTDQLNVYAETGKFFAEHRTVNHDVGYVINDIHINGIENNWMHLKKTIKGTYFHLSYHHFEGYLNEITYRWNRRKESEKFLFEDFIPLAIHKSITYKSLIRRNIKLVA